MVEAIGVVVFMAIVVGIAVAILFVLDRLTLRRGLSANERRAILAKRSAKWQRSWGIFYLSMAVIALVVNGLNLNHESLRSRLGWCIPAAVVVILFLLSKNSADGDQPNENGKDNAED
jgi:hypothetical protein